MMTWLLFFSLSSSCEATAAPAAVAVQKKTSRKRKLQQHRQQQQQQHTRDAKETHYCGIHTHAHTACGARRSKLISSRPSVCRPCNYWPHASPTRKRGRRKMEYIEMAGPTCLARAGSMPPAASLQSRRPSSPAPSTGPPKGAFSPSLLSSLERQVPEALHGAAPAPVARTGTALPEATVSVLSTHPEPARADFAWATAKPCLGCWLLAAGQICCPH